MADIRCPYLVGRAPELAHVRARLAAATGGSGGAVFVSGEPGIGKSRLVREAAALAAAEDTTVLVGRAVPGTGEAAYRPIAEALAQALRAGELPDDPELAPWLPVLRLMVPALGTGPPGAEATAHTCGEALLRILRSVRAAAGSGALVLVLEDLHWADPDTLGVLEYVADNLTGEPVLCLATLRAEPANDATDLARRLDQRGAASHLPLGRLDDDAVAEMVAACRPGPGDLLARVQATAEGVPLLVEELLATPGVPASVGEAVRTRVAELDPDQREVLYAAAVLGRDFDWELLPAATGQPAGQVTAALERMVAAMLVSVDGDGFRFRHALTREAVVALLVPPRRAAIARAALAAVDATSNPAGSRAAHADLALQAGDRGRAGALLAEAGQASLDRGALATAAQALRRAVDLLESLPDPDVPATAMSSRAALVQALALAGRPDEALAAGEALLARLGSGAGGAAADAAAVHLELARAAVTATRWPTATAHLDAAKGLLGTISHPRLAAQVEVLEAEVALDADQLARARELAHGALSRAGPAGAPEIVCHALELMGRSHRVHDLGAARDAFQRAHHTADQAGLPVWRLRALHELGTVELFDHAGTGALLAAGHAAEQLGVLSTTAVLDIQLAAAYHLRFDLDAAQRHAGRAAALSHRLGLGRTHAIATFFEAGTRALRGEREAMAQAAAETLRAAPDDVEIEGYVWAGATGLFELLWGDRAAATDALDRGMSALHAVARSSPGQYRGLWPLLHAVARHPDAAGQVAQVRESGATVMRANRGYLHYADAVIARSADQVAAGDADLGLFPVWQHLGRMLVAEAALADGWGTPRQWLQEARPCFQAHGLGHLARHCHRLLGEAPRPVLPDGVTTRESEVLQLVAAGLANKQIAAQLHVSARTVEKHVESLLRKTGAQSRTQLVAIVRETT